ncbi:hypothetical protein SAMD00023353_3100010 [Rosellinia necatrix]|uniref:Uncharacterized protein n=1 Tax=Rosellinia necatrix TaxID=77044 RepID=A0A1S8A9M8_ROSNE|nr:hypothetical protein SAMD00023353_3100010 [Rosellinia necatrix]
MELLEYTKLTPEGNYRTYNVDTFEIALDKDHYSSEKYKKLEAYPVLSQLTEVSREPLTERNLIS